MFNLKYLYDLSYGANYNIIGLSLAPTGGCGGSARGNSSPVEGWQAQLDGVVVEVLHGAIPLLWRGGRRSLTGWLWRFCTGQFPSCGGVAGAA